MRRRRGRRQARAAPGRRAAVFRVPREDVLARGAVVRARLVVVAGLGEHNLRQRHGPDARAAQAARLLVAVRSGHGRVGAGPRADGADDAGKHGAGPLLLLHVFFGRERRHAQRRMGARGRWRKRRGPGRGDGAGAGARGERLAAPEPVPLKLRLAVLANGLQRIHGFLLAQAVHFLFLHPLAGLRDAADNGGGAADGVGLGLRLGLFLLSDRLNLVEVSAEDGRIRNVLGRLGQLQQHYPRADDEESHYYSHQVLGRCLKALEQDGRCNDGGAGKVDVVGGRDHGSVEEVEGFLGGVSGESER